MGLSGLEPPTSRLSGVRSNQLSYKPIFQKPKAFEWRWRDSDVYKRQFIGCPEYLSLFTFSGYKWTNIQYHIIQTKKRGVSPYLNGIYNTINEQISNFAQ